MESRIRHESTRLLRGAIRRSAIPGWQTFSNNFRSALTSLLNKNRRIFVLNLSSKIDLDALYVQHKYLDQKSYFNAQVRKTKRRLDEFKKSKSSIFWSSSSNIEQLSRYISERFSGKSVKGLCMGSRSGEEQLLFGKNLPLSEVFGVELEASANSIQNTIIGDFHDLHMISSASQDFIYSNSHDQSNDIFRAIQEWLRLLKPSGLLFIEHSRSHGKLRVGGQDPCGIESEILPFLFMVHFQNQISLESMLTPAEQYDDFHFIFVFKKS